MVNSPKRLGEILIEKKLITKAQLHDVLLEQKIGDGFLGRLLVDKGLITNQDLMVALSEQFAIPIMDIKNYNIDMELARKFSTSLILNHKCFPLKEGEYRVTVAIINPLDAAAISKIEEEVYPRKVNFVLVLEEDMDKIVQNYRRYISESIQKLLRKKP
jgi:hypothetical protein